MKKKREEGDGFSHAIGGNLSILGLNLDLGKLLSSAEDATSQLEDLREKLKDLGGKEVLSDEAWKQGAASVSGHVRVRGLAGEREYHIGTTAGRRPRAQAERPAEPPPEATEPPLDLFDEPDGITIVADVPGIDLADLNVDIEGRVLSISTRPSARRAYKKTVVLGTDMEEDSLIANCRNGVLEIRLRKKAG